MALESISSFKLGKQTAKLINASPTSQARIFNGAGGKIFYKTASDVDTGDTEIAVGSSYTTSVVVWIISESTSQVFVENLTGVSAVDVSVTDDLTVTDDATFKDTATVEGAFEAKKTAVVGEKLTAKGELEIDGELNHDGTKVGFMGSAPVAASTVKKAELTANELATELAKMGLVKIEA